MTPRWQALIWPCAALAWTLGLAAQLQQATLWSGWAYLTLAVLGGLLGWPGRWWRVPGMALLGWAMAGLHACAMPEPMDAALEGRDLDVVGRVQAMVQRQETGTRFRFVIEEARLDGRVVEVPRQVYLGWYSASSSDLTGQSPEDVQPGERWRLRVRLKAAHGHINRAGLTTNFGCGSRAFALRAMCARARTIHRRNAWRRVGGTRWNGSASGCVTASWSVCDQSVPLRGWRG